MFVRPSICALTTQSDAAVRNDTLVERLADIVQRGLISLSAREVSKMATSKQKTAARKNIKRAANAAKKKKTISKLPKKTRTALGKQGAKIAKQKRR
jgi:ABC-type transport system involved in Fe-S cluster assembly fused permease/ATPase subunit